MSITEESNINVHSSNFTHPQTIEEQKNMTDRQNDDASMLFHFATSDMDELVALAARDESIDSAQDENEIYDAIIQKQDDMSDTNSDDLLTETSMIYANSPQYTRRRSVDIDTHNESNQSEMQRTNRTVEQENVSFEQKGITSQESTDQSPSEFISKSPPTQAPVTNTTTTNTTFKAMDTLDRQPLSENPSNDPLLSSPDVTHAAADTKTNAKTNIIWPSVVNTDSKTDTKQVNDTKQFHIAPKAVVDGLRTRSPDDTTSFPIDEYQSPGGIQLSAVNSSDRKYSQSLNSTRRNSVDTVKSCKYGYRPSTAKERHLSLSPTVQSPRLNSVMRSMSASPISSQKHRRNVSSPTMWTQNTNNMTNGSHQRSQSIPPHSIGLTSSNSPIPRIESPIARWPVATDANTMHQSETEMKTDSEQVQIPPHVTNPTSKRISSPMRVNATSGKVSPNDRVSPMHRMSFMPKTLGFMSRRGSTGDVSLAGYSYASSSRFSVASSVNALGKLERLPGEPGYEGVYNRGTELLERRKRKLRESMAHREAELAETATFTPQSFTKSYERRKSMSSSPNGASRERRRSLVKDWHAMQKDIANRQTKLLDAIQEQQKDTMTFSPQITKKAAQQKRDDDIYTRLYKDAVKHRQRLTDIQKVHAKLYETAQKTAHDAIMQQSIRSDETKADRNDERHQAITERLYNEALKRLKRMQDRSKEADENARRTANQRHLIRLPDGTIQKGIPAWKPKENRNSKRSEKTSMQTEKETNTSRSNTEHEKHIPLTTANATGSKGMDAESDMSTVKNVRNDSSKSVETVVHSAETTTRPHAAKSPVADRYLNSIGTTTTQAPHDSTTEQTQQHNKTASIDTNAETEQSNVSTDMNTTTLPSEHPPGLTDDKSVNVEMSDDAKSTHEKELLQAPVTQPTNPSQWKETSDLYLTTNETESPSNLNVKTPPRYEALSEPKHRRTKVPTRPPLAHGPEAVLASDASHVRVNARISKLPRPSSASKRAPIGTNVEASGDSTNSENPEYLQRSQTAYETFVGRLRQAMQKKADTVNDPMGSTTHMPVTNETDDTNPPKRVVDVDTFQARVSNWMERKEIASQVQENARQRKVEEQLRECTFSPTINKRSIELVRHKQKTSITDKKSSTSGIEDKNKTEISEQDTTLDKPIQQAAMTSKLSSIRGANAYKARAQQGLKLREAKLAIEKSLEVRSQPGPPGAFLFLDYNSNNETENTINSSTTTSPNPKRSARLHTQSNIHKSPTKMTTKSPTVSNISEKNRVKQISLIQRKKRSMAASNTPSQTVPFYSSPNQASMHSSLENSSQHKTTKTPDSHNRSRPKKPISQTKTNARHITRSNKRNAVDYTKKINQTELESQTESEEDCSQDTCSIHDVTKFSPNRQRYFENGCYIPPQLRHDVISDSTYGTSIDSELARIREQEQHSIAESKAAFEQNMSRLNWLDIIAEIEQEQPDLFHTFKSKESTKEIVSPHHTTSMKRSVAARDHKSTKEIVSPHHTTSMKGSVTSNEFKSTKEVVSSQDTFQTEHTNNEPMNQAITSWQDVLASLHDENTDQSKERIVSNTSPNANNMNRRHANSKRQNRLQEDLASELSFEDRTNITHDSWQEKHSMSTSLMDTFMSGVNHTQHSVYSTMVQFDNKDDAYYTSPYRIVSLDNDTLQSPTRQTSHNDIPDDISTNESIPQAKWPFQHATSP